MTVKDPEERQSLFSAPLESSSVSWILKNGLPEEILFRIFSQLPVKDLGVLYSVKEFSSLVASILFKNCVVLTRPIADDLNEESLQALQDQSFWLENGFFIEKQEVIYAVLQASDLTLIEQHKWAVKNVQVTCRYDSNMKFNSFGDSYSAHKNCGRNQPNLSIISQLNIKSFNVSCPFLDLNIANQSGARQLYVYSKDKHSLEGLEGERIEELGIKLYERSPLQSGLDYFGLDQKRMANLVSLTLRFEMKVFDAQHSLVPGLKYLNLQHNYIEQVLNLHLLPKLEVLDLSYNSIKEFNEPLDLPLLKKLDLGYNKIRKLANLEKLENLEVLNLAENQLTKIQNLESLKKLRVLQLFFNSITRIENLGNLQQLQELDLGCNRIKTIGNDLGKLRELRKLYLNGNKLSFIENLDNCKKLKVLNLANNGIMRLKGLETLTSLERLDLSSNKVVRLENIGHLKLQFLDLADNVLAQIENLEGDIASTLEELNISDNLVSTLEKFPSLPKLTSLKCKRNNIRDISGVCCLQNLEILNASHNEIAEFPQEMAQLKRLENLNLSFNRLCDVEVKDLPRLQTLNISNNSVRNLVLDKVPRLHTLNGSSNEIREVEGIEKSSLEVLSLADNDISEISEAVNQIATLRHLDVSKNSVSRIASLENLTELESLSLNDNSISRIENLDSLESLNSLRLTNNSIKKIESLDSLKNLSELYLNGNEIDTLENLDNLTKLKAVFLNNNRIRTVENLEGLVNLRVLNLNHNKITKCRSLDNLPDLQHLHVTGNGEIDVDYLSGLRQEKINIYRASGFSSGSFSYNCRGGVA